MAQQQPLPMDPALKAALLGTMTYDTKEGQSPLRWFIGTLADIEPLQKQRLNFQKVMANVLELKYMFTDLEVKESITPYPWATAEFTMYNNNPSEAPSPTNAYGVWAKSIGDILGAGTAVPAVIGHKLEVRWTEGHLTRRQNETTKEWEDQVFTAYEVISIDGVVKSVEGESRPPTSGSGGTAVASAVVVANVDLLLGDLAEGKTQEEFIQACVADDIIKNNQPVFSLILTDNGITLTGNLLASGVITRDEAGILHKNN